MTLVLISSRPLPHCIIDRFGYVTPFAALHVRPAVLRGRHLLHSQVCQGMRVLRNRGWPHAAKPMQRDRAERSAVGLWRFCAHHGDTARTLVLVAAALRDSLALDDAEHIKPTK
jgi:hypothetical protein